MLTLLSRETESIVSVLIIWFVTLRYSILFPQLPQIVWKQEGFMYCWRCIDAHFKHIDYKYTSFHGNRSWAFMILIYLSIYRSLFLSIDQKVNHNNGDIVIQFYIFHVTISQEMSVRTMLKKIKKYRTYSVHASPGKMPNSPGISQNIQSNYCTVYLSQKNIISWDLIQHLSMWQLLCSCRHHVQMIFDWISLFFLESL